MILQKTADLGYLPKKIVSLVPSQTELLYYFGLDTETIGITGFCIHPEKWFKTKTRVGGTKTINKNIIDQIQPDLIIANKEENIKEQIDQLALQYPIWLTDVNNIVDALSMITDIGTLTGKSKNAVLLVTQINKLFTLISTSEEPIKTAYLIWRNPYMTIGGDTFINDMLLKGGFINAFADKKRYPEVSITDLQNANCQLLLLSSEPYPFKQKHMDTLAAELPDCKIVLADGEMFSWYGSRLLLAPAYIKNLKNNIK